MSSQGIILLDQALILAKEEMLALEQGAYEKAIDLAKERGQTTARAWNFFNTEFQETYRLKLTELARLQTKLSSVANKTYLRLQTSLQRSRKEKQRMRGYHLAISQALQ